MLISQDNVKSARMSLKMFHKLFVLFNWFFIIYLKQVGHLHFFFYSNIFM